MTRNMPSNDALDKIISPLVKHESAGIGAAVGIAMPNQPPLFYTKVNDHQLKALDGSNLTLDRSTLFAIRLRLEDLHCHALRVRGACWRR